MKTNLRDKLKSLEATKFSKEKLLTAKGGNGNSNTVNPVCPCGGYTYNLSSV